jgi:hypothetical protein
VKKGELVRFNREVVSQLLDAGVDNWENWVGIIIQIQD